MKRPSVEFMELRSFGGPKYVSESPIYSSSRIQAVAFATENAFGQVCRDRGAILAPSQISYRTSTEMREAVHGAEVPPFTFCMRVSCHAE